MNISGGSASCSWGHPNSLIPLRGYVVVHDMCSCMHVSKSAYLHIVAEVVVHCHRSRVNHISNGWICSQHQCCCVTATQPKAHVFSGVNTVVTNPLCSYNHSCIVCYYSVSTTVLCMDWPLGVCTAGFPLPPVDHIMEFIQPWFFEVTLNNHTFLLANLRSSAPNRHLQRASILSCTCHT